MTYVSQKQFKFVLKQATHLDRTLRRWLNHSFKEVLILSPPRVRVCVCVCVCVQQQLDSYSERQLSRLTHWLLARWVITETALAIWFIVWLRAEKEHVCCVVGWSQRGKGWAIHAQFLLPNWQIRVHSFSFGEEWGREVIEAETVLLIIVCPCRNMHRSKRRCFLQHYFFFPSQSPPVTFPFTFWLVGSVSYATREMIKELF